MWDKPKSQKKNNKTVKSVLSELPSHNIETLQLCTQKCLKSEMSENISLMEKSCFNRCVIKLSQALKFTNDFIKHQNHELNKMNEQHRLEAEGIQNKGFLDKMYSIYNDHYGVPGG